MIEDCCCYCYCNEKPLIKEKYKPLIESYLQNESLLTTKKKYKDNIVTN